MKTPLASLKILIENMKENVGRYKDRDHYLGVALGIVDELSRYFLSRLCRNCEMIGNKLTYTR